MNSVGKVVEQGFKEQGGLEQVWKILATLDWWTGSRKACRVGGEITNKGVGVKLNKAWLGNSWWNYLMGIESSWEK